MSVARSIALSYQGFNIIFRTDGYISLTDMWKAAGSPKEKRPNDWLDIHATKELVRVLSNTATGGIYETRRGRGGGTYAMRELALAYGEYLSPELHAWLLKVGIERIEEDAKPELGIKRSRDRAVETWKSQGRDDKWIQARVQGVDARHALTDTLQQHGVAEGWQFAACTNAIYKPILGGTAAEVKQKRSLAKSAPLRDNLSKVELAAIFLSETLADEQIESNELEGFSECKHACTDSAQKVSRALVN